MTWMCIGLELIHLRMAIEKMRFYKKIKKNKTFRTVRRAIFNNLTTRFGTKMSDTLIFARCKHNAEFVYWSIIDWFIIDFFKIIQIWSLMLHKYQFYIPTEYSFFYMKTSHFLQMPTFCHFSNIFHRRFSAMNNHVPFSSPVITSWELRDKTFFLPWCSIRPAKWQI